ncbi:MAG: ABC transporter permease [Acidimicrobiales bacterium]
MATRLAKTAAGAGTEAELVAEIRVALPEHGLSHDLRAISIVWRRELIRFRTDRLRAITSLVQPFLFLFVLGTGLSTLAKGGLPAGVNFKTFSYPGVLGMSVLFTSVFSAGSIVWDREFGFLREMLVAPVRRASLVIGKCLGGATIATFQGIVFLALAWFAHVPYNPLLLLTLVGELLLLSFTLTAFGLMMAARIKQFQSFMALTQMLVMPLFFLSGALYPLNGLPAWLSVLTRIDPLTYIIGPMRHSVFDHLKLPAASVQRLAPNITWGSWSVPVGLALGIVAAMGLVMIGVAIAEFRKTE